MLGRAARVRAQNSVEGPIVALSRNSAPLLGALVVVRHNGRIQPVMVQAAGLCGLTSLAPLAVSGSTAIGLDQTTGKDGQLARAVFCSLEAEIAITEVADG